jgi:hypothetical protein
MSVRSDYAFMHNAYAVLTACRILYSAHCRELVSKDQAHECLTSVAAGHPCRQDQ